MQNFLTTFATMEINNLIPTIIVLVFGGLGIVVFMGTIMYVIYYLMYKMISHDYVDDKRTYVTRSTFEQVTPSHETSSPKTSQEFDFSTVQLEPLEKPKKQPKRERTILTETIYIHT